MHGPPSGEIIGSITWMSLLQRGYFRNGLQHYSAVILLGGEIAPSLYGRVDMAKYATALRKCRNFIRSGSTAGRKTARTCLIAAANR